MFDDNHNSKIKRERESEREFWSCLPSIRWIQRKNTWSNTQISIFMAYMQNGSASIYIHHLASIHTAAAAAAAATVVIVGCT